MSEKIAFIADSCADLPQQVLDLDNVFRIPVVVSCGGKDYLDGVEITAEAVYQEQDKGGLPSTSLPSGDLVTKTLAEVAQKGYDKAVLITMSSAISGTWNFCRLMCAECETPECIVVDATMASLAQGALLVELRDEVEAGTLHWADIPARIEVLKQKTKPYFGIDTLEFLQKNGRVGKATAVAGNLLNIMPILSFDEKGVIDSVEKVRGKKKRMARLKEMALEQIARHKRYRLYFVSGGCPEMMDELRQSILAESDPNVEIMTSELGCALAAHLGRNLVGVCVQGLDD